MTALGWLSAARQRSSPQFVASRLGLLLIRLGHAPSSSNQVDEDANVGGQHHDDYPKGLGPPGNDMTSKEVRKNRNKQPEPHDEDEYREHVHHEV
jgi:hypothetical protein